MSIGFIVTGTDTGLGKTHAAAMLVGATRGTYWKPVQSGSDGETDMQAVQRLTGLPPGHILPERYVLTRALSPHRAAELDGVRIDPQTLVSLPPHGKPLFIEGAGGLMVPLNRQILYIDMFVQWNLPVIMCARTGLGTINHTLLSADALRRRGVPLHGILFIGDDHPDTIRTIADFSGAKILGRLPWLETVNAETLQKSFDDHFSLEDFA